MYDTLADVGETDRISMSLSHEFGLSECLRALSAVPSQMGNLQTRREAFFIFFWSALLEIFDPQANC